MEVASTNPTIFRFGLYEVDLATMQLRKSGIKIKLQDQPFQILTMLLERPGEIVSREELFMLVWGRDMRAGDRSVDVYVRKLRVKLDLALPGWSFIHTHFGFGYRLAPELRHEQNSKFTEQ